MCACTPRLPDIGLRTTPLIRFLDREPGALLALNQDEPHMYINIEDYLYYNNHRPNQVRAGRGRRQHKLPGVRGHLGELMQVGG